MTMNARLFGLLSVALLLLAGCAEKRPRCQAYHFARSFPAAYRDAARAAVESWSDFSSEVVTLDDAGDPDDNVCAFRAIPSASAEYASLREEMGTEFFAAHRDTDGSITIAEEQWSANELCTEDRVACATSIIMHEVAHEFGLMHVEDPDAVMGTTNPLPRLTFNASDRAELARAHDRW